MAGATNSVEVVIRARNETAGAFENFGRDLKTTTQTLRVFGGAIASEINPVFGQLVQTVASASREVKNFGVVLGTAGVAAAVAAVAIADMIQKFNEASRRTIELRIAVDSLNFSSVKGQLDAATKSLEQFDQSIFGAIGRWTKGIRDATRTPGALNILDIFFGREDLSKFVAQTQTALTKVLPVETFRILNEEYGKQIQALQQIQELDAARYAQRNELENYLTQQRAIEQSLNLQADAQEHLIRQQADVKNAAARARLGGAAPGEIALNEFEAAQRIETLRGGLEANLRTAAERARQTRLDIAERRGLTAAERYGPSETYAEGFGTPEYFYNLRRERDQEALTKAQQQLQVRQQVYGLTIAQTAQLAEQSVELERQQKFLDANLDVSKQTLANEEARVKIAAIRQVELERTQPLEGLAKGFRDVAQEAESSGQIMQNLARQTAASMQQSFSNLFFDVITGNFKDLADAGKQFGLALARNFTDALASAATAPILRGLAGLTSGFFPDSGVSLLNIAPEGSGLVSSLQRAGFNVGGGAGPSAAPGSQAAGLYGSIYSGQTAQGFVESSPLGGGGPSGPPVGAGFNVGDYAGLGIGLAGLGLGIAASQTSGMTSGAFSVAAAGLTAGAGVAQLFGIGAGAVGGVAGAGGAIGAGVAIVALAAYAIVADRTKAKNAVPNTAWRAVLLANLLNEDSARIRGAGTFLELAEAIRQAMHQAYGGPKTGYRAVQTVGPIGGQIGGQPDPVGRGGGMATAGFAISIAGRAVILDGGAYTPTMDMATFALLLSTQVDTFQARLQLGAPEQFLRSIDSAFEQAVKDQAKTITAVGATLVSYFETGPGIRRTTIFPLSAIGTIPEGSYNLSLDRASLRAQGLTDDVIDRLTKAQLSRNSQTDRIPDWSRELQFVV
jgi:hypothetical protein